MNEQAMETQSAEINELAEALAKAQAAITGAKKDSANPFFKSKYADLASCWDACRGPLTDNGISVVQMPSVSPDGSPALVTTILHKSGQWIRGAMPLKPSKDGEQPFGSCYTYMRRYSFAGAVGLAQVDDDAAGAPNSQPAKPVKTISKKQTADIEALIDEVGADKGKFLGYWQVEGVAAIPASSFKDVVASLEKKRAA
jgi:hypothetical protein